MWSAPDAKMVAVIAAVNWAKSCCTQRQSSNRAVRPRGHLRNIYPSPRSVGGARNHEYLDGLQMPHLTYAQVGELEGKVLLEELQESLGGMASGKAHGPDGIPVEFYRTYSAVVLPRLLDILHEA
ncbi:hypothetical protein NDU88_004631 [Pleurodeles waltl]|uniref:Uncharacterized protein n=1 Tax=Pleurodeles waltl TaxID=8319 RepID=A0AAV7TRX3_PLEWA|nr:hypothetical protein NDU88_004631 [Pleurodeles waltl]